MNTSGIAVTIVTRLDDLEDQQVQQLAAAELERRRKVGAAQLGRTHSSATKARMSASHKATWQRRKAAQAAAAGGLS